MAGASEKIRRRLPVFPAIHLTMAQRVLSASTAGAAAYVDLLAVVALILVMVSLLLLVLCLGYRQRRKEEPRYKEILKKREERGDHFRKENGYSWDSVFVFKVKRSQVMRRKSSINSDQKLDLDQVVRMIEAKGLECKLFYSVQYDEVYCKVRASLQLLKEQAEEIEFKLKFESKRLEQVISVGRPNKNWKGFTLDEKHEMTALHPFQHIYGEYRMDADEDAYVRHKNGGIFREIDRIKLIESILLSEEGGVVNPTELLEKGVILGYFPLHDTPSLREVLTSYPTRFSP